MSAAPRVAPARVRARSEETPLAPAVVVGLMSGTSLDGIAAAVARFVPGVGHITAELLLRSSENTDGGADVQLALLDGPPPTSGDGFHSRPWIDKAACLTAGGNAADALVLRINYVSGASIFGSIATNLRIP